MLLYPPTLLSNYWIISSLTRLPVSSDASDSWISSASSSSSSSDLMSTFAQRWPPLRGYLKKA
ncbi:unnamed protein product [Gadus morhua 'NCC']